MIKRFTVLFRVAVVAAVASITISSPNAIAGQGGGGGGNNNAVVQQPIAGVDIDAQGVLKIRKFDQRLALQRFRAALLNNTDDFMRPSKLRKVSLNRLEKALQSQLSGRGEVSDELLGLAGLTSVEYVFYYPETKDIVIAGPAEGFFADATQRLVGVKSGKPVVLLEDLAVAMRAYAPNQKPTGVISVSIDPTQEGLAQMQRFLRTIGNVNKGDVPRLVNGLKNNLGLQTVTFNGIPDTTHFAQVMVEADYRMKLIGIGIERLPLPFKSYVDRANPGAVASSAMERWYFQPNYDGVSVTEDGLAMRIEERGVQLVGANERVAAGGQRVAAGRPNRASQAFCQEFTTKYPLIAQRVRVYAELEQLIDVAIAAAYIQEQDFYGQAEWDMPVLGDEAVYEVQTRRSPEQVETAVNAIWRGSTLMTPLGGGVQMQPRVALNTEHLKVESDGKAAGAMTTAAPSQLKDGQWWWD